MSLIDWSDPEEMLGLLVEYIADEARTSEGDRERAAFLRGLLAEVESVADAEVDADPIVQALGEVRRELPIEFATDPVIDHLDACIEELRRIATTSSS